MADRRERVVAVANLIILAAATVLAVQRASPSSLPGTTRSHTTARPQSAPTTAVATTSPVPRSTGSPAVPKPARQATVANRDRTATSIALKRPATRPPVRHTRRPAAPAPRVQLRPVVRPETASQRGTRVLNSLHYNWQRLGYKIKFLPGRTGYLGLTDGNTKTVTIWVRAQQTDLVLAHTIAHELGHVLDFTQGNPAKRATYLTLRGINPLTPWFGCGGCTDYATPAGDWAEVFAYWLAGPGDFRSQMAPPPNAAQMSAIRLLYS
jgi:hypothetical protein